MGVPGELVAGGDGVAIGYVGQPEKTAQSFLPDRFSKQPSARLYRSGDRVRWRPDGVLEFLGRFDNQVKIRGHRWSRTKWRLALRSTNPSVRPSSSLDLAASGAAQLVACVVPQSKDIPPQKCINFCISHVIECLPRYMVPNSFLILPELPFKPNGKIDLAALEDVKQNFLPAAAGAPLAHSKSRILGTMRDVLRHGELGPDDDFFEHGGDSLLAVTLMLRVRREFGREFPTRSVDEAFTARRLAAILDSPSALRSKYPAGVVEIRKGTAERPMFCLLGLGATALQFRTLAAKMHTQRPILGIEIHNLQLGPAVLESIEGTAEAVVGNMRQVQPIGPYAILGYSFGGESADRGGQATDRQGPDG